MFQRIVRTLNGTPTEVTRLSEYDAFGNIVRTTDRNGRVIAFDYDAWGRVTAETWYDNASDAEGNRIQRTNSTTDDYTVYEWDHRNRLVSVTDYVDSSAELLVKYEYDPNDLRISIGRFYERHFLADPHFFAARFPRPVGGVWNGTSIGLQKSGLAGRLWYGSPGALKVTAGTGAAAAGGGALYWWLSPDEE